MIARIGLALACAAGIARAAEEPSFEALGQAPIAGGDRVKARERALDEGFRQAIEQAVATILEPQALEARAAQLKLTIYPKARRWIVTYRVLDEKADGALFQVHLSAQVATAALAQELAAAQVVKPTERPKGRGWACAAERVGSGAWRPSALTDRLTKELGARDVVPVGGSGCAPPSSAADAAPDPASASASARAAGAQGALVAAVTITPAGIVRGTALQLAHARARLELVDADGRRAAQADQEGDAFAASAAEAGAEAARVALEAALRAVAPAIVRKWPPASMAGGVTVHLGGVATWIDYQAALRALSSIPGVAQVGPRRFSQAGIELGVHTAASAGQLAAALGRSSDAGGYRFRAQPISELELRLDVSAPPETPTEAPLTPPPPG